MEMREGDIVPDLLETGLSRDLVVGARVGVIPQTPNAARDFLSRYSTTSPDSFKILGPGNVKTVELNRIKLPAGRPHPLLHIISTHEGTNWESADIAVESGLMRVQQIMAEREADNYGLQALGAIGKSIDFDHPTLEDAELLRVFGDAASGPIVASVLIGAGSALKKESVPLRAILAAMARSPLGNSMKVVLRKTPEPALVTAGVMPAPQPLLTATARRKALQVLEGLATAA